MEANMKAPLSLRIAVLSVAPLLRVLAAPGDVDLRFDPGSGIDSPPAAVAVQPDGKVIIGSGTTVAGLIRHGIARLNPDGVGDPTFDTGIGLNGPVWAIALQPDGKTLIGG